MGKNLQKRVKDEVKGRISEGQSAFNNQQIRRNPSNIRGSKKAYDNVPRNILWGLLKENGVSDYLIEQIQNLYRNNTAIVKQGCYLSEPIRITKGLRCCLSPLVQ